MEDNWKQELMSLAQDKNMCDPFNTALKKCVTKEYSLRLYKAGIDWALENDFAGIDFLRSNYTKKERERFGVYIDREFCGEVVNDHIFQVFHNCTGSITVELNQDKLIIPTLYLANGTNLKVDIKGTDISVYLFDNSKIESKGKYTLREVVKDCHAEDAGFKPNIMQPDL